MTLAPLGAVSYPVAVPLGMAAGALIGLAIWWMFGRDPGDPL